MRGIAACLLLGSPLAAGAAAVADDHTLARLLGIWAGTGEVQGEPVTVCAQGEPVLGGAFVRLQLIDREQPPAYQALIFIARAESDGAVVGHWLDGFGADGARVVGIGADLPAGDGFELSFPYASATFRDRFRFIDGGFELLIDAQADGGAWAPFAAYRFVRGPCPASWDVPD